MKKNAEDFITVSRAFDNERHRVQPTGGKCCWLVGLSWLRKKIIIMVEIMMEIGREGVPGAGDWLPASCWAGTTMSRVPPALRKAGVSCGAHHSLEAGVAGGAGDHRAAGHSDLTRPQPPPQMWE